MQTIKSLFTIIVSALFINLPLPAATPQLLIDDCRSIYKLTSQTILQPDWGGKWRFVPTVPDNWHQYPAKGVDFELKNCRFDLDTLAGKPFPGLAWGTVYKKFTSPRAGYALIGIGADWWFEAACNGKTFYSTFPYGNYFIDCSHTNYQFMIKVKKGENILAVRLRRGDAQGWTFACGKVDFFLPPLPALRTQAYLLNPANGQMSIGFETYGNIGGGIDYRIKGSQNWQRAWDHDQGIIKRSSVHLVHLKDLQQGALYEYRTVLIDPISPHIQHIQKESEYRTFRVPSAKDQHFSFIYTADLQFTPAEQLKMLRKLFKAADAASCDYIVLGGDIYDNFDMRVLLDGILSEISSLDRRSKKSHPLIVVRGNHELRGKDNAHFNDLFGTADGRSFGIYHIGKTALLKLDSWEDKPQMSKNAPYCKYTLDDWIFEEQNKFLEQNLPLPAWKNAEKRIVLSHGATYSHNDRFKFMTVNMRNLTDKYFAGKNPPYPLTLFLAGHIHGYRRSLPASSKLAAFIAPTKPLTDGKNYTYPILTTAGPSAKQPIQASVFRITIKPGKLEVKTFTPEGKLIEHFEISDQGKLTEKKSLEHHEP